MEDTYHTTTDAQCFKVNVSGKNSPSGSLGYSLLSLGSGQTPQASIQMRTYPTDQEVKAPVQETDAYHGYRDELATYQTTMPTMRPPVVANQPATEGQASQATTDTEATELPRASPAATLTVSPKPVTGTLVLGENQDTPQATLVNELPNGNECDQCGVNLQQENQQTKGTQYIKEVGPFVVTTANLSNSLATLSLSTVKTEHFQARAILHPNMVEKGTGNSSARVQLRLAVSAREKLKKHLLSKTVTSCKVALSTKVMEKGTGKLLAKYDNQQFQLPPQGIANCLCELITNKELDESNSKKIDIYVTISTHVQDWEPQIKSHGDDCWHIT